MELRVLKYFLMVAREENITRAAELLHITQPTLSRQLIQLEEDLGVKLFHRSRHRIVLTEEGMLLRRRAEEIVSLSEKTVEDIRHKTGELTGKITIGSGEFKTSRFLAELIASFHEKHPQVTFELYSGNADNIKERIDQGLEKRKPDCFAVKQYKKYKLASGKTARSILISCGARLAPFDIPQLREIMSYDEMELGRMGDRRTATFFVISDTDSTYNFLVALAFSQMFNLLCERADNVHGGRLPHHVRVLWDEAANTEQVPELQKLVAVIRSREISLCLFYQQMAQCKAIYKDNAETILGNMDSVIFLGGRESSTIKEISENWLGKATISMQTEGRSRGQSESFNLNTQRLGRELMTPAELATMPGDKCILQLRGLPPFFSHKYDLKQHPNYKYTAEADKRNAFDLGRLIDRRMKDINPDELYTVYEVDVPDEHMEEDEDILNYDDLDDPDTFV